MVICDGSSKSQENGRFHCSVWQGLYLQHVVCSTREAKPLFLLLGLNRIKSEGKLLILLKDLSCRNLSY